MCTEVTCSLAAAASTGWRDQLIHANQPASSCAAPTSPGQHLVEVPIGGRAADIEVDAESGEGRVGQIQAGADAAHALVDNRGLDRGTALADGDGLAAVWVAVALGAHHADWQGDDEIGLAIGGLAARAEAGLVVGDVAVARGA